MDHGEFITPVAGKRLSLLMVGDDDEVFMTRSLNVTPKTTLCSDKSEAYVTIIKVSALIIILLRLTTDRHKASRGLCATAELLVEVSCMLYVGTSVMVVRGSSLARVCTVMNAMTLICVCAVRTHSTTLPGQY